MLCPDEAAGARALALHQNKQEEEDAVTATVAQLVSGQEKGGLMHLTATVCIWTIVF